MCTIVASETGRHCECLSTEITLVRIVGVLIVTSDVILVGVLLCETHLAENTCEHFCRTGVRRSFLGWRRLEDHRQVRAANDALGFVRSRFPRG